GDVYKKLPCADISIVCRPHTSKRGCKIEGDVRSAPESERPDQPQHHSERNRGRRLPERPARGKYDRSGDPESLVHGESVARLFGADLRPSGILPGAGAGSYQRVQLGRLDAEGGVPWPRDASGIPASGLPGSDCDVADRGYPAAAEGGLSNTSTSHSLV